MKTPALLLAVLLFSSPSFSNEGKTAPSKNPSTKIILSNKSAKRLPAVTMTTTAGATPPTPINIQSLPDDRVCTVYWDNYPSDYAISSTGYQVQFGKTGEGYGPIIYVVNRVYQVQPMDNGATYNFRVRSLDNFGQASSWSSPVSITANSTRVDAVRSACLANPGGFFDDFNRSQGVIDTPQWNKFQSSSDPKAGCYPLLRSIRLSGRMRIETNGGTIGRGLIHFSSSRASSPPETLTR